MKSASELSKKIRDQKRKNQEGDQDLQDAEIEHQNEATDELDKNEPEMHNDENDQSPSSEMSEEQKSQSNHKDANANHEDNEKELLRRARLKKSMRS